MDLSMIIVIITSLKLEVDQLDQTLLSNLILIIKKFYFFMLFTNYLIYELINHILIYNIKL